MKYLFLNNENIDVCLPPYLRINMTIWLKNKYQILTYHVNNTSSKLAPDSILNKQIKEIMRYTGGTPDIPLFPAESQEATQFFHVSVPLGCQGFWISPKELHKFRKKL